MAAWMLFIAVLIEPRTNSPYAACAQCGRFMGLREPFKSPRILTMLSIVCSQCAPRFLTWLVYSPERQGV